MLTSLKIDRMKIPRDLFFAAALMAVWALQSFLIDPRGEFPLNDDWIYSRSVWIFFRTHQIRFIDWQVAATPVQTLWGGLVSLFAGFSMTALRLSVVFLGGAGVLLSYALFREFHKDRFPAFFAALLIAVNPIFVVWSHSFMTDVPFATLSVASFLMGVRWLKYGRFSDWSFYLLCACLAALVRQPAMVIPLAFVVAVLVKRGKNWKGSLGLALAAFASVIATMGVFQIILQETVGIPSLMTARTQGIPLVLSRLLHSRQIAELFIRQVEKIFFKVSVSCGFFMFPAILLTFLALWPGMSKRARIGFFVAALGGAVFLLMLQKITGLKLPIGSHTLRDFGLGPLTISGATELPEAPPFFWRVYGFWGSWGAGMSWALAGLFLFRSFRSGIFSEKAKEAWPFAMALTAGGIYFFFMTIVGHFDRYEIFYGPLFLLVLLCFTRATPWVRARFLPLAAFLMTFAISAFSVAGTHDYIAWNRVRWQALRGLMTYAKVPPSEIDGGFEFNGWYLYDPKFQKVPGKNWYWVMNDTYRISFSPLPDYRVLQTVSYPRWLPFGENRVLLLRRVRHDAL